jgi:hypothetical protein
VVFPGERCPTWNVVRVEHVVQRFRLRGTLSVKSQKRGSFVGTPLRRGYRGGQVPSSSRSAKLGSEVDPTRRNPSSESPPVGQRSAVVVFEVSEGGSATMTTPLGARRRTAHSAVAPGEPNDRDVTSLKRPSSAGVRARSSARPSTTWQRSPSPSSRVASRRNRHRRPDASSSTTLASGHAWASASPGTPPPAPRSQNSAG